MSITNGFTEVLKMKQYVTLAFILVIVALFITGCGEGSLSQDEINNSSNSLVFDRGISWSPDSTMIAYISNSSIVVKNIITDKMKQLTGTSYYDELSWSPDNIKLAYMSSSYDMKGDIWIKNADGLDIAKMFTSDPAADYHPRWSPDGKRILFHSYRNSNMCIYLKSSDGTGEEKKIADDPAIDQNAEWSLDGKKIAFESKRAGNYDIWIADVDGTSTPFQITTEESADTNPLWSPDGSRIAFKSDRFGIYGIWVKNADGSGDAVHISFGFDDGDTHDWSSNGKYIAFVANNIVYVRNSDGTGEPVKIGEGLEPKWSPDGTKMAYVALEANQYKIKIMDLPVELR
jgi:Tol biopolymer transport system component